MLRTSTLKRHWGLIFLALQTLYGVYIVMFKYAGSMHYDIFVGAGPVIWRGEDPFIVNYLKWNRFPMPYPYSLAFAMYYFYPFSFLPPWWGTTLYLFLSLAVLFAGVYTFGRTLERELHFKFSEHPWHNWILTMIAAELFGAIVYTKIEMIQLGVLFFALNWIVQGRTWLPYFVIGLLAEIKFQLLPVIGLLFVVSFVRKEQPVKALSATILGYLVPFLMPLTTLDWSWFVALQQSRAHVMDELVTGWWLYEYQHVFKTLYMLGVPISLSAAKVWMVFFAGFFGLIQYGLLIRIKDRSVQYLSSAALGLVFLLMFSPVSQTNAYSYFIPLLMLVMVVDIHGRSKKAFHFMLIGFFLISIIYSDLVPLSVRRTAVPYAYKPWGLLSLLIAMVLALPKPRHTKFT